MSVTTQTAGQELQVRITLINDQTGHAVPTDSPLRHLILLVKGHDSSGKPLTMIDGPRLPAWTGVGDPDSGFYAGQAGMAFAKVLGEQWTNVQPTGAYWNPTYLVSDNRLFPFEERIIDFNFATHQNAPAEIHIRLLYRRAFIELANQKGWNVNDILMEEQILKLTP